MGRRLVALLIVLMINAALLPLAAAASIEDETNLDYPVSFSFVSGSAYTPSNPSFVPFRWPLSPRYTYSVSLDDGIATGIFTPSFSLEKPVHPYLTYFLAFQSDELVTSSRFNYHLYNFSPALIYNKGTSVNNLAASYVLDFDDFSSFFDEYSISYYLVNSQTGDVIHSYTDYISLPFDGSWNVDLSLASSTSSPYSFDTIVVGINAHMSADNTLQSSFERAYTKIGLSFSSAAVTSTESTSVVIDGTNDTLDRFFDSYQQQYDQVSAGIVTNLNTGISTIVSEAKQQSNNNISEFIDHSGQSEQASLDWGFRNTMIAINNAGAQVSHSIGQAASSTVAATQAAAQNISQNIVATGETINTTLTGLPEAIGNKVTDLFVPKEEDLAAIKDDYEGLLEEKLGAVYQVEQYGQNLFGSVAAATETDTITFPGISVPVGQGENFVMESAEVALFPAGLDVLKNCVKFLVTAAFVAAWVLGLQRYYDKIMGDRGDE